MSNIYLKEEHLLLQKMVRDFSNQELKPIAQDIDKYSRFPEESIKKISELGLMGIPWSPEYGGAGMDNLSLVIAIEEMAKVHHRGFEPLTFGSVDRCSIQLS